MASISDSNTSVETWKGSCHCGKVRFTVSIQGSIYEQETTVCNCECFFFEEQPTCLSSLCPDKILPLQAKSSLPALSPRASPSKRHGIAAIFAHLFRQHFLLPNHPLLCPSLLYADLWHPSLQDPKNPPRLFFCSNPGSICQRNGYLFIYPKDTDVTWHSGREMLKSYAFASNSVGHRFCPECGTSICAKSDVPGFLEGFMALNVSFPRDLGAGRGGGGRPFERVEGGFWLRRGMRDALSTADGAKANFLPFRNRSGRLKAWISTS